MCIFYSGETVADIGRGSQCDRRDQQSADACRHLLAQRRQIFGLRAGGEFPCGRTRISTTVLLV